MGNLCGNASAEDQQAAAQDAAIEREMLISKLHELFRYKILLLGAGESGKSTIVKQLKLIHQQRFDERTKKQFVVSLHQNAVDCVLALHEAATRFGYEFTEEEQNTAEEAKSWEEKKTLSPDLGARIGALYRGEAIQQAYARRNEFWLLDACEYYMENLERFCAAGFMPTDEDMLMARVRTTGIITSSLETKRAEVEEDEPATNTFEVVDVGGQRNERKKWIHCFDDVKCILFIVSLAGYDQVLFEDSKMNRMQESLTLFKNTLQNPIFRHTPVFLFLNKKDLFEKMLRETPLTACFDDYKGESKVMPALQFIEEKFRSVMPPTHQDNLFVEYVTGVYKKDVQSAFSSVKQRLFKMNEEAIRWQKGEIRKEQKANKKASKKLGN